MYKQPQCSNPKCFMPAVLMWKNQPFCIDDYKILSGGRF